MSNRLLPPAIALALTVCMAVVYVPLGVVDVFGHQPPMAAGWLIATLGATTLLAVDAIDKAARRRAAAHRPDHNGITSKRAPTSASGSLSSRA